MGRFGGGICFAVSTAEAVELFAWAMRPELQQARTDAQQQCVDGGGGRECRVTDAGCNAPDIRQEPNGCKGPYANGERHGTHICPRGHGEECEFPWVNGEVHGTGACRADGYIVEFTYVNGSKHGIQVHRFANGDVIETPFVDGRLDGASTMRRPDGSVISAPNRFARDNPYKFARAARVGGEEALQKVLAETGSHINQPALLRRNMGQGALYFAIEQDSASHSDDRDVERAIEVLIAAGADIHFVNVTDWTNSSTYDTPLHQAARRNSTAAVIPLIAAGADVNALNNDDESPLDHAVNGCVYWEVVLPNSGFVSDPGTAAIIAMAGGRLNAPMSFGDILARRLGHHVFGPTDEDEALVAKAMKRCYPKGIEWETR